MSNGYILSSSMHIRASQRWVISHSHRLLLLLLLLFGSFFHRLLSICTPFSISILKRVVEHSNCVRHSPSMWQTVRTQHAVHSSSHIFNYNWCLLLSFWVNSYPFDMNPFHLVERKSFLSSSNRGKLVRFGRDDRDNDCIQLSLAAAWMDTRIFFVCVINWQTSTKKWKSRNEEILHKLHDNSTQHLCISVDFSLTCNYNLLSQF